jgi:hypothetical protein
MSRAGLSSQARACRALISGALLACALFALLAGVASPARADLFGPIELTSTSAPTEGLHQQAEEARFPVISADGDYVAFVGSYGGVAGIWRRDLLTGKVEQVAPGDATLPSISADGRYVSFSTNERLLPEDDTNNAVDVYVRDMETAEGEPEYILVSAVNGTEEGATYTVATAEDEKEYGSLASARSAMSANGELVVFVTTAQSNLLGGSEPTPPMEVMVRDLATMETRLVSAEYDPGSGWAANRPVQPQEEGGAEYGALFVGSGLPRFDQEFLPNTEPADNQARWVGASISADGSTVAWMGQDLARQTQLLAGEQSTEPPVTAEPLWRRIDEPDAPIRRITGGSDPESPACIASGEQQLPSSPSLLEPCAGPFEHLRDEAGGVSEGLWGTKVRADFVPQLSENGTVVAFVTDAHELAGGEVEFPDAESDDDLYIVNMASGLTRVQSLRRLTAIAGGSQSQEQIEKSAAILDFTVAPNGGQVAFVTQRTVFPLGSPAFVSTPAAVPGMQELFDVDLEDDTLTRVTHGYGGEDERSEQIPTPEQPGSDPYHAEQGSALGRPPTTSSTETATAVLMPSSYIASSPRRRASSSSSRAHRQIPPSKCRGRSAPDRCRWRTAACGCTSRRPARACSPPPPAQR